MNTVKLFLLSFMEELNLDLHLPALTKEVHTLPIRSISALWICVHGDFPFGDICSDVLAE